MKTVKRIKELPILFNAPMVRAILAGHKTQTRRVVRPQPIYFDGVDAWEYGPFAVGQRLWVRETWQQIHAIGGGQWHTVARPRDDSKAKLIYAASLKEEEPPRWKPSIHMPRWASRITLEIIQVRVERLQKISVEDAAAEGFGFWNRDERGRKTNPLVGFCELWNTLNKARNFGWKANPRVWAITFQRVEP